MRNENGKKEKGNGYGHDLGKKSKWKTKMEVTGKYDTQRAFAMCTRF